MFSTMRGWMLGLSLPVIAAGSARAQEVPKTGENAVPRLERGLIGTVHRLGHIDIDGDGVRDLSAIEGQKNWSTTHQFIRWPAQPVSDDVGAELTPVDAALRAQLNLLQDVGLVVTNVAPDGRAARAGLKANDILLTLAGSPLGKPEDLLSILKARSLAHPDEPTDLNILRGGKPVTVKIKAEVRVALAATATEGKPSYYIGTFANPLDETFRAHLDVPAGTGLIVGEITEGTPAAKAGVKPGDILLAFAGDPLPDEDALRAKIQATGPHPAKLSVMRAGKPMTLTVTPEPRKSESWVAELQAGAGFAPPFPALTWGNREKNAWSDVALINKLYAANLGLQQQAQGLVFLDSQQPAPADLTKKIDELTAQVQALTKAVEGLKASQVEKK